jgi:hypothetical protein
MPLPEPGAGLFEGIEDSRNDKKGGKFRNSIKK